MIDPSQTAFVPCRSLMDNILLSQELLRNYHRESPCPRCAIKVDFQKAYDSNNWNFILDTLHCFNFPSNVIQWIRTCITTPSFSIPNISTLVSIKLTETTSMERSNPAIPYRQKSLAFRLASATSPFKLQGGSAFCPKK